MREAFEHAGARLRFLAHYCPDLTPIEPAVAKLKAFAAPRNGAPWQACDLMALALGLFRPDDGANYVRHSDDRLTT